MPIKILEVESNYEDVTYTGYKFRVEKYVYPYFLEKDCEVMTLFEKLPVELSFRVVGKGRIAQYRLVDAFVAKLGVETRLGKQNIKRGQAFI